MLTLRARGKGALPGSLAGTLTSPSPSSAHSSVSLGRSFSGSSSFLPKPGGPAGGGDGKGGAGGCGGSVGPTALIGNGARVSNSKPAAPKTPPITISLYRSLLRIAKDFDKYPGLKGAFRTPVSAILLDMCLQPRTALVCTIFLSVLTGNGFVPNPSAHHRPAPASAEGASQGVSVRARSDARRTRVEIGAGPALAASACGSNNNYHSNIAVVSFTIHSLFFVLFLVIIFVTKRSQQSR